MSSPPVEGYRLSPAQQRLWRLHGRHVGPYRVRARIHVTGAVDPGRLDRACRDLTRRQEILRTRFVQIPGLIEPIQVVEDHLPPRIVHADLRRIDAAAHEEIIGARDLALADTTLDVEQGPAWIAHVFQQTARESTLLLVWPALIADSASAGILARQLARAYAAIGGAEGEAGEEAWQHVDLSEWQHQVLEAEGTAAGRHFWREIPPAIAAGTRLPLRRGASHLDPFSPQTHVSPLPAPLTARLADRAWDRKCALADVFLACWTLLVSRLTESRDLCLGVVSHGRTLNDLHEAIGPFTKTLPVRFDLAPASSFERWLERTRDIWLDHRRWHECFAWPLYDASTPAAPAAPGADAGRFCPLAFEVIDEAAIATPGGPSFALARIDGCGEPFELKLTLTCADGEWHARWDFDPHVHALDRVIALGEQFAAVLGQIAETPLARIADVDVRGASERARLEDRRAAAAAWSREGRDPSDDACVHTLFEARVKASPGREAIAGGDERLTYGQLGARVAGIAARLRDAGVGPETRVGVMLEPSIDLVAAVLGILQAGGAFVPLPPEQPIARLTTLAARTHAPIVITHSHLAHVWPAGAPQRLLRVDEAWGPVADAPARVTAGGVGASAGARGVPATADNLAYVLFTSGSTGEPKGVMVSHRAIVSYIRWCQEAYLRQQDAAVPLHSPLGFDATLTSLLAPLCTGARIVVVPHADPVEAFRTLARSPARFAFVKMTPAHLAILGGELPSARLPTLTDTLIIGGAALAAEQLSPWHRHAPLTRIVNEYGPTEAAVGCVVHDALAAALEPGPVPIGSAIPGVEYGVLDDTGREAPIGAVGELFIGGVQLARGYDGRPNLTADRFVPAPGSAIAGARWYRTGDLVRTRADGTLEYVGRRDRQVKLRGHRVELAEIEAACRRLPGVREAAVMLREDAPGEPRLVAYLVSAGLGGESRGGEPPEWTIEALRDALGRVLPDVMLPSSLVPLEALPLTRHGKVDEARLPAPASGRSGRTPYLAPRSATEATLAAIWADVLQQPRVGVHDNFFALGGDSILSLQIVARAARAGLRLAPRHLFAHRTVAALAALADADIATARGETAVTGSVPLTPIQHWFFERVTASPHHFNHAVAFDLLQPIDAPRLDAIWRALQRQHDALRLRYRRTPDGWVQHHADPSALAPLAAIDIAAGPSASAKAREAIWRTIARDAHASLNLANGPLARAVFMYGGGDVRDGRLLIVVHHLLVDGVSWRVLLEDLHELCVQQPPAVGSMDVAGAVGDWRLPAKTLSFKAWSERLASRSDEGGFDAELPFWREMSQPAARLALDPIAGADAGVNDVRSARVARWVLDADATSALTQRMPAALGVRVQEVLLAAVLAAFAESGGGAWRIDLEGHGRDTLGDDADVTRTVGWYTSLYPVRVELSEGNDPILALRAVRRVLARVPGSGAGYGALRYLRRDDASASLRQATAASPEIVFNYWGQIGRGLASSPWLKPSRATRGRLRAADQTREYVIEISASVADGRLQVQWTYSANLHRAETIERLAARTLETLRALIALPAHVRPVLQTPADFPLARVSQSELDALVARHGALTGLYPLSPLQEGLLFQWLRGDTHGAYVQQAHARLDGPLDPDAFRSAWELAVARHDALRTSFVWERPAGPLQVVRAIAPLPWRFENWRHLASDTQEARLAELLAADRGAAFTLDRPPLMRMTLLRLGEDAWEVVWTSHHLILDGWSGQVVLRDVLALYLARQSDPRQGGAAQSDADPLPMDAGRYADYIAWLQTRDAQDAETFWRGMLEGLRVPCLLAAPSTASSTATPPAPSLMAASAVTRATLQAVMPANAIEPLRRLGQTHGITMNTWFAGTLALLLAYATRQDDVVMGTVVSGRPPHLPGIETTAGLFANTVPLRLTVTRREAATRWFAACQQRQVESRDYEYASLARIQGWSELPPGTPLFDTLFAYENYPAARMSSGQTGLRVASLHASAPTTYPLTIEVTETHPGVTVSITHDDRRIGGALAAFVARGFETVLSRLCASPAATVEHLLDALDREAHHTWLASGERRRDSRRQALQAMRAGLAPATAPPQ